MPESSVAKVKAHICADWVGVTVSVWVRAQTQLRFYPLTLQVNLMTLCVRDKKWSGIAVFALGLV
jgi:hypothetical protein